jgi:hypothetical protein
MKSNGALREATATQSELPRLLNAVTHASFKLLAGTYDSDLDVATSYDTDTYPVLNMRMAMISIGLTVRHFNRLGTNNKSW